MYSTDDAILKAMRANRLILSFGKDPDGNEFGMDFVAIRNPNYGLESAGMEIHRSGDPFDLDEFLARPLFAHLATGSLACSTYKIINSNCQTFTPTISRQICASELPRRD